MQSEMVGHAILGAVTLTTLVWLGLVPAAGLLYVFQWLLAWAALSTLLVGSAGAWVALGRFRRLPVSLARPR
ncbi:MAG: hypothetical protein JWP04_104 [Belnapia sp.]|jgi:hypothetical protein|nr:hypothetical protein [Belnapia sp.]